MPNVEEQNKQTKLKMKFSYQIIIFFIIISLNSCAPFNLIDNLEYNESVQLYEYPINEYNSVYIRNKKGELINQHNIDSFKVELEKNNNKYSFDQCFEKDALKASDYTISKLYSEINSDLENQDFVKSKEGLKQLKNIYPNIKKYSDYLFLNSIMYVQADSIEKANETFNDFLKYSSGSYSKRIRGYRDADFNDSIFTLQRLYAKEFLKNPKTVSSYNNFKKIEPKYHYNCFKPGYLINPENYDRGTKWITSVVVGLDVSNYFALGYQVNRNLTNGLDANLSVMASHESYILGGGLPIQIYKTPDDRFGLKVTPFLNFMHADSANIDEVKYEIDSNFFNFGLKISAGYYFLPNFSVGAYYKYNFRNESNPIITNTNNIYLWWANEYDVSLYYDLFKNFSFKGGVYNGDLVGGVLWSGWEISYNLTTPGLILKVDMY